MCGFRFDLLDMQPTRRHFVFLGLGLEQGSQCIRQCGCVRSKCWATRGLRSLLRKWMYEINHFELSRSARLHNIANRCWFDAKPCSNSPFQRNWLCRFWKCFSNHWTTLYCHWHHKCLLALAKYYHLDPRGKVRFDVACLECMIFYWDRVGRSWRHLPMRPRCWRGRSVNAVATHHPLDPQGRPLFGFPPKARRFVVQPGQLG